MNIKEFKKVVIFGSYNKQSVGDKAILISIIDLLFKNTKVQLKIEVICFDAEAIKEELSTFPWSPEVNVISFNKSSIKVDMVKKSSFKKAKWKKLVPLSLLHSLNSIRFYLKYKPNFNTDADLLIIGGGNLLMDMFPSWLIMPFLISRKFSCPYVIAGVGAFPIKTELGNFLIKRLLKKSALNFVRDEKTYNLIKNKYRLPCALHPDFAFSYPNTIKSDGKIDEIIAVNIAPIYGEQWPYTNKDKYNNFINMLTESLFNHVLAKKTDSKILFFDSNYPTDRSGAKDVINQLLLKGINKSRLIYLDKLLSSHEIIQILNDAKYCIVTRLHAGILALDANLPVLGIAYQPKVKDVFNLVGLGNNVIDIDDINELPKFLENFSDNYHMYTLKDDVKKDLVMKNNSVIKRILEVMN
jgi:polysaccharide pyruvyl transferase WcaK-like protein